MPTNFCVVADVRGRSSGLATEAAIATATVQFQIDRALSDMMPFVGDLAFPTGTAYDNTLRDIQADIAEMYCLRFNGASEGVANKEADRLLEAALKRLKALVESKQFTEAVYGLDPVGLTSTEKDDPTTVSDLSLNPRFNTPLQNFRDPTP